MNKKTDNITTDYILKSKMLTYGLIISCIVFAISICAFLWGMDLVRKAPREIIGLQFIVLSFFSCIISIIFVVRCKSQIDTVLIYGLPIHNANQKIVDIINSSTGYGVDKLHSILKDEIIKQIDKAGKKRDD